jgi:hypothetical protein
MQGEEKDTYREVKAWGRGMDLNQLKILNGNGAMPGGSIKRKSTTETKQALSLRHCCWRAIFKKEGRGEQALLLKK